MSVDILFLPENSFRPVVAEGGIRGIVVEEYLDLGYVVEVFGGGDVCAQRVVTVLGVASIVVSRRVKEFHRFGAGYG